MKEKRKKRQDKQWLTCIQCLLGGKRWACITEVRHSQLCLQRPQVSAWITFSLDSVSNGIFLSGVCRSQFWDKSWRASSFIWEAVPGPPHRERGGEGRQERVCWQVAGQLKPQTHLWVGLPYKCASWVDFSPPPCPCLMAFSGGMDSPRLPADWAERPYMLLPWGDSPRELQTSSSSLGSTGQSDATSCRQYSPLACPYALSLFPLASQQVCALDKYVHDFILYCLSSL